MVLARRPRIAAASALQDFGEAAAEGAKPGAWFEVVGLLGQIGVKFVADHPEPYQFVQTGALSLNFGNLDT